MALVRFATMDLTNETFETPSRSVPWLFLQDIGLVVHKFGPLHPYYMNDYCLKPVDLDMIKTKLKTVLKLEDGAGE